MKQKSIPALMTALMLASPVVPVMAQDAVPSTPAAQVERQEPEKTPDAQPEQPVNERGEPASKEGSKEKDKKKKKASDADWGFRWTDHPSLRLGPGTRVDFRARLTGNLQDTDVPVPDDETASPLNYTRRRIGVDGEILNLFDYQVEGEIDAARDPWRDVYLNYKQYAFAQVQGGKFKLPFSLDQNTSLRNLDFVYRSRIASLLAPGRDRGVMVHGRVLRRGLLRYEFGVFAEDGNLARTFDTDRVHGERTLAGRAMVQPFRSMKSIASDLAVGVSFTSSDLPEGVSDLRGRTEFDASFYRPDVIVNGRRQRIGFEARWRPGPFSIKSEYIRLTDQRIGESVEDTDLAPFVAAGWYVSGTWALTGERKADGLDTPRRPLFQGGFGAIEVAARVERIRFGSDDGDPLASDAPRTEVILGNGDRVYTFGVNWYANHWIKIQTNLVRNSIALPELGPLPSQAAFWSRIVRFQFSM